MKILTYVALLLLLPVLGKAATTQTFNATATIQLDITMSETTPLNFGIISISATKSDSTISIDASNKVTQTGNFVLAGTPTTGVYAINGTPNAAVNLSVGNIVDLTLGSTKLKATITLNTATVTLSSAGSASFKALGSIVVPSSTSPGVYRGSFDVTAIYN